MVRRRSRVAKATGLFATLLLLLAAALSACSNAAPARAHHVSVTVRPQVSLADEPVHVAVSGLAPGELATIAVRSTDARGVGWAASAVYRANASGEIDLSRAPAMSGSYRGTSAMGLIWSMHPTGPDPAGGYFWDNAAPLRFTITVTAHGGQVGSATFRRQFSHSALTD